MAFPISQILAAMLGLAGPVAVGAITGHPQTGMAVALGGLALGSREKGETFHGQLRGFSYSLVAGSAAVFAGTALAECAALKALAIPAIAAAVSLIGGISRPLARLSALFILFMIIAANAGAPDTHPLGMMFLFALGAIWAAALSLALDSLLRAIYPAGILDTVDSIHPQYTMSQLLRRWRGLLAHLSGWQYALCITVCLIAAQLYDWLWPHHHGYWVAVTVVIVLQRDLQRAFSRTLERAIGTVLGVVLMSLIFLGDPPIWVVIGLIAALAAARPLLREASYAAYAAVMTPLVILLLDFGKPASWTLISDRLIATLSGCALVLILGYLPWLTTLPQTRGAERARPEG